MARRQAEAIQQKNNVPRSPDAPCGSPLRLAHALVFRLPRPDLGTRERNREP